MYYEVMNYITSSKDQTTDLLNLVLGDYGSHLSVIRVV